MLIIQFRACMLLIRLVDLQLRFISLHDMSCSFLSNGQCLRWYNEEENKTL